MGGDNKIGKLAKKPHKFRLAVGEAPLCRCGKKKVLLRGNWRGEPVPFAYLGVGMRRAFPSGNRGLEVAFAGRQPLAADFVKSTQSEKRPKETISFCLAVAGKEVLGIGVLLDLRSVWKVSLGRGEAGKRKMRRGRSGEKAKLTKSAPFYLAGCGEGSFEE